MPVPFKKGNQGKPKGALNKTTQKVKDAFASLLENNLEKIQSDLDAVKPAERLTFILSLAEYILPKLARVEAEHEIKDASINLIINPVAPKKIQNGN